MGKRKCEDELQRFVWKRNVKYDLMLLTEVEYKNPFALTDPKPVWMNIAKTLQEGTLKMKVTDRSCRERVTELLEAHRDGDITGHVEAYDISKEGMTKLKKLLTRVAALENITEAESVKSGASFDICESKIERSKDESSEDDSSVDESSEDESSDDSEPSSWHVRSSNPQEDLIRYLEKKNEKEMELRKEELRIRKKEAHVKAKELKLLGAKAEAEVNERKTLIKSLVSLVSLVTKK